MFKGDVMNDRGPSYASCKKELKTGMKVTLPDGGPGIFMKMRKTQCEVLVGGMDGKMDCVSIEGVILSTYGVRRRGK